MHPPWPSDFKLCQGVAWSAKEAQQPQDLLIAHHQQAHGDGASSSCLQLGNDQVWRISSLAIAKHAFHLIALAWISKQLLPVLSIYP